jgi:hypothetical protein
MLNINSGELLSKSKNTKIGTEAFWTRVDDIARARLEAAEASKLHLKGADTLHRELLQELDRWGTTPFFLYFFLPFTMWVGYGL